MSTTSSSQCVTCNVQFCYNENRPSTNILPEGTDVCRAEDEVSWSVITPCLSLAIILPWNGH